MSLTSISLMRTLYSIKVSYHAGHITPNLSVELVVVSPSAETKDCFLVNVVAHTWKKYV